MSTYKARIYDQGDGVVSVEVGFGEPASNDRIVVDAVAAFRQLELKGGAGIHLHGPASLPVAMAIAHQVAHVFGYVACWDPKLARFVVAISHDPGHPIGLLVEGPTP